jgi:hypothetical protein
MGNDRDGGLRFAVLLVGCALRGRRLARLADGDLRTVVRGVVPSAETPAATRLARSWRQFSRLRFSTNT